jgi:hypothetical protein
VVGIPKLDTVLCPASSDGVNDGVSDGAEEAIESLDTDRDDSRVTSFSSSSSANMLSSSSSSVSSAGSNNTSRGVLNPSDEGIPSSCLHSWMSSSIDIRLCRAAGRRRLIRLGGGIAVTANKAATAGGNAFESCFSLSFRPVLPPYCPLLFTVCACDPGLMLRAHG